MGQICLIGFDSSPAGRRISEAVLSVVRFRFLQHWGTYRGYHYAGKVNAQLHRAFLLPAEIFLDQKSSKPAPDCAH